MVKIKPSGEPRHLGRYALYQEIASGGMASVHIGRLLGPAGFSRTVAIKRLHAQFAKDPEFTTMFLDEARLAARIAHPNVVPILDVVATGGELFLVMDYVQGESLFALEKALKREGGDRMPIPMISAVLVGCLAGLHAAHGATNERGEPLMIVHRDVSPQNIMVGHDGVPRMLDFGIAKAIGRQHHTGEGVFKGKLLYMAPEQLLRDHVDARTDVYAAGVVLWSLLAGHPPFEGSAANLMMRIAQETMPPIGSVVPELSPSLQEVVDKALTRDPKGRFSTALEMAEALEAAASPATQRELARWVEAVAGGSLRDRALYVAAIERQSMHTISESNAPPPVRPSQAPTESLRAATPVVAPAAVSLRAVPTSHAEARVRRWPAAVGVVVATAATVVVLALFARQDPEAVAAPSASTPAGPPTPSSVAPTAAATGLASPPTASALHSATATASAVAAPKWTGRPPAAKPACTRVVKPDGTRTLKCN